MFESLIWQIPHASTKDIYLKLARLVRFKRNRFSFNEGNIVMNISFVYICACYIMQELLEFGAAYLYFAYLSTKWNYFMIQSFNWCVFFTPFISFFSLLEFFFKQISKEKNTFMEINVIKNRIKSNLLFFLFFRNMTHWINFLNSSEKFLRYCHKVPKDGSSQVWTRFRKRSDGFPFFFRPEVILFKGYSYLGEIQGTGTLVYFIGFVCFQQVSNFFSYRQKA